MMTRKNTIMCCRTPGGYLRGALVHVVPHNEERRALLIKGLLFCHQFY